MHSLHKLTHRMVRIPEGTNFLDGIWLIANIIWKSTQLTLIKALLSQIHIIRRMVSRGEDEVKYFFSLMGLRIGFDTLKKILIRRAPSITPLVVKVRSIVELVKVLRQDKAFNILPRPKAPIPEDSLITKALHNTSNTHAIRSLVACWFIVREETYIRHPCKETVNSRHCPCPLG